MTMIANFFKRKALLALVAVGAVASFAAPASAHYVTSRCDWDGDDCYRVVCDDDGDDCRAISHYRQYNRPAWGGWSNNGGVGFYFDQGFDGRDRNGYRNHGWYRHRDDDDDD